ncbi:MAG TPA: DUF4012 domain-containing protein [Actinomycetota bacterium]|nr:DUF4012 domain-containing protein [Actinomycetota bacterium]
MTHGSVTTAEPFSLQSNRTPRRDGRRLRLVLPLSGALLVLAVAAGLALLLRARTPLVEARAAMLKGRNAVLAGDLQAAGIAFARADASFDDALETIDNPLTRIASWIPLVGQTPDAVRAAAEAGRLMARAGVGLTQAAEDLPGGVGALAPRDGTIPLEPLRSLTTPLARALVLADRATVLLEQAPRWVVPAEVAEPLESFTIEARGARRALAAATATAWALPAFLGADGTKRYFLGAQNPAELRGTGGLIGAYAIMTAEEGRIEVGPFLDVEEPDLADVAPLPPPGPDYEALYGSNFRSLSNVNLTPDFPTAARAIERLHEATTGTAVDGTILADPQALSFLLRATGPATVPATGTTVDADSVIPFVANEAYTLLPNDVARKQVLGDVAAEVLNRFLSGAAAEDPAAAGRAIIEAAAGGHLLLHSADPAIQVGLQVAGVTGNLADPGGDFVGVMANNAAGNKIDFYARRSLDYDVVLLEDGSAQGELGVTIANEAPTTGQPGYVIGPHPFLDAAPGDNITNVQAYCSTACRFQGVRLDGARVAVWRRTERGHPVVVTGMKIPSGSAGRLEYAWTAADAWSEEAGLIVYRLTVQGQPTIVPTVIQLSVAIPENASVARTSPEMTIEGDRVAWEGEPGTVATFEVAFKPS